MYIWSFICLEFGSDILRDVHEAFQVKPLWGFADIWRIRQLEARWLQNLLSLLIRGNMELIPLCSLVEIFLFDYRPIISS